MCDSDKVIIPDSILEQLRCAICSEYLSCAPVQVLPDGASICGHCGPSASDAPSYRVSALEAIISKVAFPCKHRKYGCNQRLVFGEVREHETTCTYRGLACPGPACLWEGSTQQVSVHYLSSHPERVVERAEFKLELDSDEQGILMVAVEDVTFMVEYKYDAVPRELYYDLRYFKPVVEASSKICLVNGSDRDYTVTAKGSKCQIYDYSFSNNSQLSNVLAMSSLLPALNHPNCVTVAIDFIFTKSENGKEHNTELLKCAACREYLTLPTFESNGDIVCSDCCQQFPDAKLASSGDVMRRIINSLIPCRWQNCRITEKEDKIRKHEKECEHRVYRCIVPNCNKSFDNSGRSSHMGTHPYRFFITACYYTMNFGKIGIEKNYFYTIANKEIIIIKTETISSYNAATARETFVHRITPKATDDSDIRATIVFNHAHCHKSKEFVVTNQFRVTADMLPECFKPKDELAVTIRV